MALAVPRAVDQFCITRTPLGEYVCFDGDKEIRRCVRELGQERDDSPD